MITDGIYSRRKFLRYATVSGVLVPMFVGSTFSGKAQAYAPFNSPKDPSKMTDMEKLHMPSMVLPPVVEDGSQAPVTIEMDHPMEPDHYIKSIQILNFTDPIVIKGQFYFTPANGTVYLSTQIRLAGGEGTVWCVAECNQHGKWATSKDVKVAAGGC
ncbi:thiosulfate oxidation carrier protein SoxY [Pseudomonadota bacterium]